MYRRTGEHTAYILLIYCQVFAVHCVHTAYILLTYCLHTAKTFKNAVFWPYILLTYCLHTAYILPKRVKMQCFGHIYCLHTAYILPKRVKMQCFGHIYCLHTAKTCKNTVFFCRILRTYCLHTAKTWTKYSSHHTCIPCILLKRPHLPEKKQPTKCIPPPPNSPQRQPPHQPTQKKLTYYVSWRFLSTILGKRKAILIIFGKLQICFENAFQHGSGQIMAN